MAMYVQDGVPPSKPDTSDSINISLPFKDQKSARVVRRQLSDLSNKIGKLLRPVFIREKIGEKLRVREMKPVLLSQQCVVYHFTCDQCEAGYVGYTCRVEKRTKILLWENI